MPKLRGLGIAPDQNRTDTSSLEGYGSTIELQAQTLGASIPKAFFFCKEILGKSDEKGRQDLDNIARSNHVWSGDITFVALKSDINLLASIESQKLFKKIRSDFYGDGLY